MTHNFPLSFIETYLKKDIKNDLKQFYAQFENEDFGERIKSIDREKHIVQFMKDEYALGESDFEEVTFEQSIKAKLDKELIKAKRLIELGFKNCFIDNKDANRYGDFLMIQLGVLKKISTARDFPILNNFLIDNSSLQI